MEKADIQKSLIIFNCFVLSWSDVRVNTRLVHGSVSEEILLFSAQVVVSLKQQAHGLRLAHAHGLPGPTS